MGRVCCWLPIGGGYSVIRYAMITHNGQIRYSKVLFSHFIVFGVYFIIFRYKRAENAKKRPFIICIIASVSLRAVRCAFGTAENTHYIYHLHTHKKHTHIF